MKFYSSIRVALTYAAFILQSPTVIAFQHASLPEHSHTMDVNALFRYTTSRNHKVIMQAVDFVTSMQSAPTCTRLAASHLMRECKMLEHAPDFAKQQPDAYLDNIKTEYAAKLAVCELLSAQPSNPLPPPHCDILVPSSRACTKSGGWWHKQPEVPSDKQCYPELKDYQYAQCLKSLQSTPQFWTSFSNARHNALVICQASRDAIEREGHLETFKNLTQVLDAVTVNMQKSTEQYEHFIEERNRMMEEAKDSHRQAEESIQVIQEKALATVGVMDNKFHDFMEATISELTTALEHSRTSEIAQLSTSMQAFSQELMHDAAQLAKFFTGEYQQYHQVALQALRANHEAQTASFERLSGTLDGIHTTVNQTSDFADQSLAKAEAIAQRLDTFESQTEHIAEGVAFLSALPSLVATLVHWFLALVGVSFTFAVLYKVAPKLATYAAGICCSLFLFHAWGVFHFIGELPTHIGSVLGSLSGTSSSFTSTQKGAAIIFLLWFSAYPICRLNAYVGSLIGASLQRLVVPLWIREYGNESGFGLLPSIEIPQQMPPRKA